MTQDERRLLRHPALWVVVVAGPFGLLVSAVHDPIFTVLVLVAWWIFLYVIFYREAHRDDHSN